MSASMSSSPSRGTILVVDDDRDVREGIADVLIDEGYVVAMASHGAEALAKMRNGPLPRLVLLDLMMPVLDGWGFRASQRADPALSHVPVILVTASGNCRGDDIRLGFDACLPKPIALDRLFQLVAAHLAK
jgi:CheY-like chemotaxis protein